MPVDRWTLYRHMLRSRRLEEAVHRLWNQGRISGEMHLGTGTEAVAAGVVAHLGDGDAMALDHRGTPQLVVRGVDLTALLAECMGLPEGLCRGHGGHMHLFSPELLAASSGIVGASAPAAVGFALSAQLQRPGKVAVAFFGEGAMNQGMVLEAFNLAVAWRLPVLFVCKDNKWAITTPSKSVTGGSLVQRAAAFGLPSEEVDGTDVEAVWFAADRALQRARVGDGPAFLLAHCTHLEGHFLGDPLRRIVRRPLEQAKEMAGPLVRAIAAPEGGSPLRRIAGLAGVGAAVAQTAWEDLLDRRDPLRRARRRLRGEPARLDALEREVGTEIADVVAAVVPGERRVRRLTFAHAIEDALMQAMAADERVVVFGEDVLAIRRNLVARFGDRRVRNAPISESAFVGAAVTAALGGLRPVVEVMLVDFIGVAMDAVLNHAAKVEAFTGGRWRAPMVIRASCGGGYGDGGQHEQSLWGWLAHIPGLTVVVPSSPRDAGGLMLAAIEHEGPVVFLEHKLLADYWLDYMGVGGRDTVSFDVPADGAEGPVPTRWDATPLGQAVQRRDGKDVALVSVGVGVHRALAAAERLHADGISAAVLDLRSVSPLDRDAVLHIAAHTGRVVVVDEDYRNFGLSGEIAATIAEAGVRASYARVCCDTTIPFARALEDETLPNVGRILDAVRRVITA